MGFTHHSPLFPITRFVSLIIYTSFCLCATKLKWCNAFACTWHFLKGFVTLYAIFLKAKICLRINWILKIMVQFCYLRLFKHWICFLFSVATWWRGCTWTEKGNGWVNPFLVLIISHQNHQTLPASSSGASFFAWQRRARNEWLVMNRKEPWEGYRRQSIVSFPPSFARTFSLKERRLGTRRKHYGWVLPDEFFVMYSL